MKFNIMLEVDVTDKTLNDIRPEFEKLMKRHFYRTDVNEDGEYVLPSVFHMWTGFCLAAELYGIVKPYPDGFWEDYAKVIDSAH